MITSLYIQGFQSADVIQVHDMKENTIYLISGTEVGGDGNRVGKTVFAEAIQEGHFGYCSRGHGNRKGQIIVTGIHGGVEYKSHRTWSKSTDNWKVTIGKNDTVNGLTKCRELMADFFGVSYNDFVRLQFLQKQAHNLTGMKTTDRSEKAIKFLKIPTYSKIVTRLKNEISRLDKKIQSMQVEHEAIKMLPKHSAEEQQALELEVNTAKKAVAGLTEKRITLQENIKGYEKTREVLSKAIWNIEKTIKEVKSFHAEVEDKKKELKQQQTELTSNSYAKGKTKSDLKEEIEQAYQLKEDKAVIQSKIKLLESGLDEYAKAQKDWSRLTKELKHLEHINFSQLKEDKKEIEQTINRIKTLESDRNTILQDLSTFKKDVQRANESKARSEKTVYDLQGDLDKVSDQVTCPLTNETCPTLKAEDITAYSKEVNQRIEDAKSEVIKTEDIIKALLKGQEKIEKDLEHTEKLLTEEKAKPTSLIAIDLLLKKEELYAYEKEQLQAVNALVIKKGFNKEYPTAKNTEIEALRQKINKEIPDIEGLKSAIALIDKCIGTEKQLSELEQKADIMPKLDVESQALISKREELAETIQKSARGSNNLSVIEADEREEKDKIARGESKLSTIKDLREKTKKLASILADSEASRKRLIVKQELLRYFKALPIYEFDEKLSIVEGIAQDYKNILTDKFDIVFQGHKELKNESIKLMWEILIRDELGSRTVPLNCSGAEDDIINFAIKSAMQDMLRIDKDLISILLLDEPFTSYADAKVQNFLTYLTGTLKNRYSQIFLIAHDPRIKNHLDEVEHIKLIRGEDGLTRMAG